ncbi:MAG: hypothetical protein ACR2NO_01405, partial [Chloroflexota bacterium]
PAATFMKAELPFAVVPVGGAVLSWSVAAMLTAIASRASQSAAWVGMGHIPVLMAAATAAACIVPLGLAKPVIGYALSGIAFLMLATSTFTALRHSQAAPVRRAARRASVSVAATAR